MNNTPRDPHGVVDPLMALFEELHHNLASTGVLVERPAVAALVMEINILLAGVKGRGSEVAFWQAKLDYLRYKMTKDLPVSAYAVLSPESEAAL